MGFGTAISTCWSKWAGFQGRASRSEYWYWQLFQWLAVVALFALGEIVATAAGGLRTNVVAGLVFIAFLLVLMMPSIAVTVRRLHDLGFTGWLMLVCFIPYAGGIVLLVLMVTRGTRGPNRYGADSLDPLADAAQRF